MKKTVIRKLTGVKGCPMLQHNGQMANPLNPIVKAMRGLTAKRKKTEADLEAIARLEWLGGLYLVDQKPILPGDNVEAAIIEAAKKEKGGRLAKSGIVVTDSQLEYPDRKVKIEALYDKENYRLVKGVVVAQSRIFRTRPKFDSWNANVSITYDDSIINESQLDAWLNEAGQNIGVGDWRPKYGRFTVSKK